MADILQARVADAKSTKEDVHLLQVSLGVNFSRDGLLFDADLRERGVAKPISGTVWDWMHVLVSNGVGNLESEKFIAALIEEGVPCKQLDEFVSQFKGVQGFSGGHLPGDFFQTRFKKDSHGLKAFASEMLSVLPLMRMFAEMVLVPTGKMVQHTTCFATLCDIVEILRLGDHAVEHADLLNKLIQDHNVAFCDLYGADSAIPKLHYLLHIATVLKTQKANWSCFVTERKHKSIKRIAARSFANFTHSLTCEVLSNQAEELASNPRLYLEVFLDTPQEAAWAISEFQLIIPHCAQVHASSTATLMIGSVRRNDIVMVQCGPDSLVGAVLGFFEVTSGVENATKHFFVHVAIFRPVGPMKWHTKSTTNLLYPCGQVVALCMYAPVGDAMIRVVPPPFKRLSDLLVII